MQNGSESEGRFCRLEIRREKESEKREKESGKIAVNLPTRIIIHHCKTLLLASSDVVMGTGAFVADLGP
ncbi:hypothetical protein DBV15_10571 [Temnothorax longispinosus]|uniref:Uncharacterized protein n=1 Tax=Temnothorax longispinosus TaxID=300112 RepID=A0A4S2JMQ4_9HYME|nr:hypothetical protein DBV15_10571 [Temnothorax longispinosus]